MLIEYALNLTQNPCTYRNLWKRLDLYQKRKGEASEKLKGTSIPSLINDNMESVASSFTPVAFLGTVCLEVNRGDVISTAVSVAADNFTGW